MGLQLGSNFANNDGSSTVATDKTQGVVLFSITRSELETLS